MTPAEIKAICDAVGGVRVMAELLEVCERQVYYMLERGLKRRSSVRRVRDLVRQD